MVKPSCLAFLLIQCLCALGAVTPGTDIGYLGQFLKPTFTNFAGPGITNGLIAWYQVNDGTGTTVKDSWTNALNATASGSPTPAWQPGPFNKALAFGNTGSGAVNSVVTAAANNLWRPTDNFTVSFWMRRTNSSGVVTPGEGLANQCSTGTVNWYVIITSLNAIQFNVGGGTLGSAANFGSNFDWTFIVCSFTYPFMFIYTNGFTAASGSGGGHPANHDSDPFAFGNGQLAGTGTNLNGYMTDVRFYSGYAWSPDDVYWMYKYYYGEVAPVMGGIVAADWEARVKAHGGADPTASTNAIAIFIENLTTNRIRSLIPTINVIAPDNLTAALTPIGGSYGLAGNDPWVNHNFVAGDLTANGLKGNTTTKYAETGFNPRTQFGTSYATGGFTVYAYDVSSNAGHNGSAAAGFADTYIIRPNPGNFNFAAFYPFWNGGAGAIGATNNVGGFLSVHRTSNTSCLLYGGDSSSGFLQLVPANTEDVSSRSQPNVAAYMWALNNNGTASDWSDCRLSFVAMHYGLSSNNAAILFNAVQTLRTNLGGGYR